jgi:putative flippase GtrA
LPEGLLHRLRQLAGLYLSRQFLVFLLCGGGAALLNWLSRFAFSRYFTFGVSVTLAYVVGMVAAYALFRVFVFRDSAQSRPRQASAFILVNAVGFLQTLAVSEALGRHLFNRFAPPSIAEGAGHAVGVGSVAVTSFLLHKFITFASRPAVGQQLQRD